MLHTLKMRMDCSHGSYHMHMHTHTAVVTALHMHVMHTHTAVVTALHSDSSLLGLQYTLAANRLNTNEVETTSKQTSLHQRQFDFKAINEGTRHRHCIVFTERCWNRPAVDSQAERGAPFPN